MRVSTMNPQCIICFDSLLECQNLVATNCGHIFHRGCLLTWFRRCTMCPHCDAQCVADRVQTINFWSSRVPTKDTLDLRVRVDELKLAVNAKDRTIRELKKQLQSRQALESTVTKLTSSRDALLNELRTSKQVQRSLNDQFKNFQQDEVMRRKYVESRYHKTKEELVRLRRKLKNYETQKGNAYEQLDCPTVDSRTIRKRPLGGFELPRKPLVCIENFSPSMVQVPKKRPGLSADANSRLRRNP